MKASVSIPALALFFLSHVSAPSVRSAEAEAAAASKPQVALKILKWEQVDELIQSKKVKIVVVDLWSTYCPPCVREFPNLVKLHKKYGKEVACVSVNLNYAGLKNTPPEALREDVEKFLQDRDATFANVLCSTPDMEVFERIDLSSIPAVYVYGRDGKLVKRFDNSSIESDEQEFTYKKDVEPLVERLVQAK